MSLDLWQILAQRVPEMVVVSIILVYVTTQLRSMSREFIAEFKASHKILVEVIQGNQKTISKLETHITTVIEVNSDLKDVVKDLSRIAIEQEKAEARKEGYVQGKQNGLN